MQVTKMGSVWIPNFGSNARMWVCVWQDEGTRPQPRQELLEAAAQPTHSRPSLNRFALIWLGVFGETYLATKGGNLKHTFNGK